MLKVRMLLKRSLKCGRYIGHYRYALSAWRIIIIVHVFAEFILLQHHCIGHHQIALSMSNKSVVLMIIWMRDREKDVKNCRIIGHHHYALYVLKYLYFFSVWGKKKVKNCSIIGHHHYVLYVWISRGEKKVKNFSIIGHHHYALSEWKITPEQSRVQTGMA